MSYQVLARKWRPQNFFELVGQNSARQTLTNALKSKRLYPVLIFTGPRGTGKTSTARILAKSLRCQNKTEAFQSCGTCEDCLLIADSRHLDVIEIDGASNNGVDAIRELRDTVSYMPSTGYWKIYIIDEVHMLSQSAFNALLKTLEEPPEHVLFIMATTESHKIPATVLSRCQKIDFHLLSPLIIKEQLEKISQTEGFQISESVLWILAQQAQGSLRDAQSLLDQVITFCGETLNEEEVRQLLGLTDPQILNECLQAVIDRDEQKMIPLIANLRSKALSPKVFLENLLSAFSHLLFLKKNPDNNPPLVQGSKAETEQKKKQSALISYEELHFLFDMLLKGEREMSSCYDSELVLEVLLLRLCSAPQLEELVPFTVFKKKNLNSDSIEDIKKFSINSSPATAKTKEDTKSSLLSHSQKTKADAKDSLKNSSIENKQDKPVAQQEKLISSALDSTQTKSLKNSENQSNETRDSKHSELCFQFLDHLRKKDKNLCAYIENFYLIQKGPHTFELQVPQNFSYLKKKREEHSFQVNLERELSNFLGLKEKVKIDFSCKKEAKLSLREEKSFLEQKNLLKKAQNHSAVQQIKSLFHGEIKSVKKIDKKEEGF